MDDFSAIFTHGRAGLDTLGGGGRFSPLHLIFQMHGLDCLQRDPSWNSILFTETKYSEEDIWVLRCRRTESPAPGAALSRLYLGKFANAAVVSDMAALVPGVKHHSYSWGWCQRAAGSCAKQLQGFFSSRPTPLNIFWQNVMSLFPHWNAAITNPARWNSWKESTAFRKAKSILQSCFNLRS